MILYDLIFATMLLGVLVNKLSIKKMKQEIIEKLEPNRRPNMEWWNLGRQFQMLRAYRALSERRKWSEVYVVSACVVILPLVTAFAWAAFAALSKSR